MNKIRTIVVEDEQLPRLTLLQKLDRLKDEVEVVDACDNYEDAYEKVLGKQPDLLLLDIQLQGRDSISLLRELKRRMPLPLIIFTTAYEDRNYMMSAIKLQAADYLLKPISLQELTEAIGKVKERIAARGGHRTCLRTATGILYAETSQIAYIKAARNYSVLVCFDREEMLLDNLITLEQQLDETLFVRIDRSTIVNRQAICMINKAHMTCQFRSAKGEELKLQLTKVGLERLMAREYP